MEDYELSVITGRYHLSVGYPEEVAMEDYELSVITATFVQRRWQWKTIICL